MLLKGKKSLKFNHKLHLTLLIPVSIPTSGVNVSSHLPMAEGVNNRFVVSIQSFMHCSHGSDGLVFGDLLVHTIATYDFDCHPCRGISLNMIKDIYYRQ